MRTDYDKIAERYDEDRKGQTYAPHRLIRERLDRGGRNLAVLDVGCGPGRWLQAQCAHFRGHDVTWAGLEPFSRMLGLAWKNAPGADILPGRAESLPFGDSTFDLVRSVTSFHHFEDKEKALDEIVRVLRPGGVFEYGNIEPWSMRGWWPYVWFPEFLLEDEKWFWQPDRLAKGLRDRGLDVTHSVNPTTASRPVGYLLDTALRRTLSNLAVIDDETYERGVNRLRQAVAADPKALISDEFAWMMLTATKAAA